MRLGPIILGYAILMVLLVAFGVISETVNPFIKVLFFGEEWTSLLNLTGTGGIIVGATTLLGGASFYGVITKNRYMIFAPFLTGVVFNYTTAITPIISYFPDPLGYIIYGILNFVLIWTAIEFWGGVE